MHRYISSGQRNDPHSGISSSDSIERSILRNKHHTVCYLCQCLYLVNRSHYADDLRWGGRIHRNDNELGRMHRNGFFDYNERRSDYTYGITIRNGNAVRRSCNTDLISCNILPLE